MDKRVRSRYFHAMTVSSLAIVLLVSLNGMARQQPAIADSGSKLKQSISTRRRPRVKLTGWINETASTHWLIGDHELHIDPASPTISGVETGMYAVAIARTDDEGNLHAESISLQPPGPPLGYPVEFRGLIQEMDARYWVVDDRLVFITKSTSIQGQPEIGALAEVKGTCLFSEVVLARSIKVAVPGAHAEVEFEGVIESMSEDTWIVSGVTVTISPVTVIEGTPALGLTAEVQGVLEPDGSVLAQQIAIKDAIPWPEVDIEGLVESIEATHWVVAGMTVLVDAETFIDDSRAPAEVGMWAQVRALRRQDGSLLALRIRLSRPN